jgi:uncharacterized membrane protein
VIVITPMMGHSTQIAAPTSLLYAAASRICHQRPERSFFIAGFQMPVCARCSGLYVSGALGALLGWAARSRPRSAMMLIVAAIPTVTTFALEFLGVMRFSNSTRAMAALPLGIVAGWVFVTMLRYDFRLDANKNAYS